MSETLQPGVAVCVECATLIRPFQSLAADYPGTRARAGGGRCKTCYAQKFRKQPPKKATDETSHAIAKTPPKASTLHGLEGFMRQRNLRLARLKRMTA